MNFMLYSKLKKLLNICLIYYYFIVELLYKSWRINSIFSSLYTMDILSCKMLKVAPNSFKCKSQFVSSIVFDTKSVQSFVMSCQ